MMQQFFSKILIFLIPLFLAIGIKEMLFERSGGDLSRIGVISVSADYRDIFKEAFNKKKAYTNFSENIVEEDTTKARVLIIGDSFSRQKNYGYRNFLAVNPDISVVYYDFLKEGDNPISILNHLSNGDFFEHNNFDYVVLGSVERSVVQRAQIDLTSDTLNVDDINQLMAKNVRTIQRKHEVTEEIKDFYTNLILYFQNELLYRLDDNAFQSKVYQLELKNSKFTHKRNILIYANDMLNALSNSSPKSIMHLNQQLNTISQKLSTKGVDLIFLPAADKFDFYYDEILGNEKYAKPTFFESMNSLNKNFRYLDSKGILSPLLEKGVKDIYFYDDTHWSPIAAEEIAKELERMILKKD